MNNFDEQLPADLAAVGELLQASRPQATDQILHDAFGRAAAARSHGRSGSLLWASSAPRLRGRAKLAVATLAGTVALAGATTGGVLAMSSAAAAPSTAVITCPTGSLVAVNAAGIQICVLTTTNILTVLGRGLHIVI